MIARNAGMKWIPVVVLALAGLMFAGPVSHAQPRPVQEPIILTVDGKTGDGAPATFTRSQLEALGSAKITTHTPWHDGAVTFEGVPMRALLARVGAKGDKVTATALDKYAADVPITDFAEFNVILAYKLNGKIMSVEEKGPLFIVYPYDSDISLATEAYYVRSVWQIARLTIE
jgi:hypothetical protein